MTFSICIAPGCYTPVRKGRCSAHARPQTYGRGRSFIPGWSSIRKAVLARYPICRICTSAPSNVADHIIPVAEGGTPYDPSNLQGICEACSRRKSGAEGGRGRANAF